MNNSTRVTRTLPSNRSQPEYSVSHVSFSVGRNSPASDRRHTPTVSSVIGDRGQRQITLAFSCSSNPDGSAIPPDVKVEGYNSSELNAYSGGPSRHTSRYDNPTVRKLYSSNNRKADDFHDKSDAFDLPFIHTSNETQNREYVDNKLSPVNNTGKPCEHMISEQTHRVVRTRECVLQTRHDQDNRVEECSTNHGQSGCRRSTNLSPRSSTSTRTIVKPFPVYGSAGTTSITIPSTSSRNRDKVNIVGFSSPSRNAEKKNCWLESGHDIINYDEAGYTVSTSPIHVTSSLGGGGLGLTTHGGGDEYTAENNGGNITDYKKTLSSDCKQAVPTILTITPSSSEVRATGDRGNRYTVIRGLERNNVGITELRISSSCNTSLSVGERSLSNMDSTNNNPMDGIQQTDCLDESGQSRDKNGLQAGRVFKPIQHDISSGRSEDISARLSAHERTVSSSSSAPTTPSFPKPFVQGCYDTGKPKISQHGSVSCVHGISSRAEEVSSMAKVSYRNSSARNSGIGIGLSQSTQDVAGSARLGFGPSQTVASLKPLGVAKLAKVSRKSLQSFDDFTPQSSPSASRRSSISSQDLSDATNEVKVLLSKDVNAGDSSGHSVRVSAVQVPKKANSFRQSSLEIDSRMSPMDTNKKFPHERESPEVKNKSGLRTDFSAFRLHVSPLNSPKSFIRTHTTSAPSSPVRSLQGLTIKMKETPPVSPLLSPRDTRPFSPMSEPAEDQGCVPDIQDEIESCSQTLPRNFSRRRPKTAPSVPTALLREVTSVEKELKDKVSAHRDSNSPLKFSFQPINMKIREDTSSDSDRTILPHGKNISNKKRKKPSFSGQSTDSSESNGESNGRSKSDPTQDRKRSGERGESVFENLHESQKGHSSSSIVSAESALSISSANTTLSDPNVDESFVNAYEDVLNEPDGSICDSLDHGKNGKTQLKQKSLTWPNGEKSENDLSDYCSDKINMASSAPEVSELDTSSEENLHSRNRSPVMMPKQQSLTDSPKRADSFSDPSVDSVRHKRSTSEPVPIAIHLSRSDSGSDRQLPTLTVTTSQESAPTKKRFERKKPIIGSIQGTQFLQPEPLEDQPITTGSTPDLSQNSRNSRLESLMSAGSCATLPRAAVTSKVGELSPKTKQKRKKEVSGHYKISCQEVLCTDQRTWKL